MQIIQRRGRLSRTLQALENGRLSIGFAGGSITDARPDWNWPEPVITWFADRFPRCRILVNNDAIGATGSDLAAFRAQASFIDPGCDLVFIEFAVNDQEQPTQRRMRSREGLIRKLLKDQGRDIVLVYTFSQPMYAAMSQGQTPASIAEFEQLADHYQISSVWMGMNALQEVQRGLMRWEEWLPDGLHPQARGSLSYAQSVIACLEEALTGQSNSRPILSGNQLPPPLENGNWENVYCLPFDQVELHGPWILRNWPKLAYVDRVLSTAAVGAKLSFTFEGRGLVLGFDFGRNSGEFRYRLDGAEWQVSHRDRPDWCPPDGWYRLFPVAEDLTAGKHRFEMEVIHGNPDPAALLSAQYAGTNIRLAMIGIVPYGRTESA